MHLLVSKTLELTLADARAKCEEVPRGSNGGPYVEEILRSVGLGPGYSWCGALIHKKITDAQDATGVTFPWLGWRARDCDEIYHWAINRGLLHETPQAGDIFLWFKTPGDAAHTGQVTRVDATHWFTVEGNTKPGGSVFPNGYGVFEKSYPLSSLGKYRFVRWTTLVEASNPVKKPRLLLYLPNLGTPLKVETAAIEGGTWWCDGLEMGRLLNVQGNSFFKGRNTVRVFLAHANLVVDEARTAVGNKTSDENDPRQYVFTKAVP